VFRIDNNSYIWPHTFQPVITAPFRWLTCPSYFPSLVSTLQLSEVLQFGHLNSQYNNSEQPTAVTHTSSSLKSPQLFSGSLQTVTSLFQSLSLLALPRILGELLSDFISFTQHCSLARASRHPKSSHLLQRLNHSIPTPSGRYTRYEQHSFSRLKKIQPTTLQHSL